MQVDAGEAPARLPWGKAPVLTRGPALPILGKDGSAAKSWGLALPFPWLPSPPQGEPAYREKNARQEGTQRELEPKAAPNGVFFDWQAMYVNGCRGAFKRRNRLHLTSSRRIQRLRSSVGASGAGVRFFSHSSTHFDRT